MNKEHQYESHDRFVSHPDHYQSETGLEAIDVIEAFTFDLKGVEATDTGNILKYACRWKKKNGVQDLEKILWYTQHLIDHVRSLEKENNQPTGPRQDYDFQTQEEAENVLNSMHKIICDYGTLPVADMHDLCGIGSDFSDNKIGWTNDDIANVTIRTIPRGIRISYYKNPFYKISLPTPHTL